MSTGVTAALGSDCSASAVGAGSVAAGASGTTAGASEAGAELCCGAGSGAGAAGAGSAGAAGAGAGAEVVGVDGAGASVLLPGIPGWVSPPGVAELSGLEVVGAPADCVDGVVAEAPDGIPGWESVPAGAAVEAELGASVPAGVLLDSLPGIPGCDEVSPPLGEDCGSACAKPAPPVIAPAIAATARSRRPVIGFCTLLTAFTLPTFSPHAAVTSAHFSWTSIVPYHTRSISRTRAPQSPRSPSSGPPPRRQASTAPTEGRSLR